ncbi:WD repeat-containing protein 62 isoform X2 [Chrysoperla carnea]|uniref:WD repeat-containing protein 62 isoform X2 n=1 Tax=Chrysoperla carnea TaxID=189513 RepID=UPI001D082672|nr:WD repeat-containing protein 62 isoform X2 [Chrysoperla carnea]
MEPPLQGKMVIRAPSLKRAKSEEGDRFQLEHVMGVTLSSNSALVTDPNSHLVAYPSGCTVVLYNSATCVQQAHIINTCRKTITALAFSSDGRYLATGECGHLPYVRIWDLQDTSGCSGGTQIAEFQGHQYGINCVAFSPSNKYVVSIGSQHDMIVNVWDWKNNLKIASNKVSQKIKGVCFAQDGSYFVTVGNRHVKFWYLEYTRNTKYKEAVPLVGRAAILGSQRGQNFVAVACGRGECSDSTYVVTKSGLLCQLNNRRLLDKWLELRTSSASSMTVGEKYIFVGCAEGIVRCFDPFTLNFVTTLPRTHHLGVDVSLGTNISHMSIHPANAKYPDTVAVAYDEINHKLTSVYNDHSIYVWDVREVRRVGKSQSFLYHSACIWGIEMIPTREEISLYRNPIKDTLPDGCFITCSSDDTIRIWNLEGNHDLGNIYSNELLKIIYMDPDLNYIKDQDQTLTGSNDKVEISYDGKNGVRCIRIRPDAIHLAAGDRAGNIKIHDMRTMKEIYKIEAHDAEVLCLEYSKNGRLNEPKSSYPRLLASASRDRLIHVFNVDDHYNILQTLDDHSSSITAVRLISTAADQLKMISCGADKSIIFRNLMIGNNAPTPFVLFQRDHNVAGRTTLYDMEIDANSKHILTACQDRNVRLYSTKAGQYVRSIRGSPSEDGSLIKVTLNTSGRYMATSCTDKTLAVYCAWSGQLLACVCGHSELATGLKFTKNSDRLVSAGGDASILLWKHRQQKKPLVIPSGGEYEPDGMSSPTEALETFDPSANLVDTADYRFSVGPLPLWAKKQITEDANSATSLTKSVDLPKGRWAQRVEQGGISVRSVFDTDSIIAFPERQDPKPDSDGSKDSSIDSGTESRNYPEYRRESTIKFKQSYSSNHSITMNRSHITSRHHPNTDDSSLGSMLGGSSALGGDTCEDSNADNDGDVEDCSDTDQRKKSMKLQFPEVAVDSPSEYTVNAMSVDELRKSLRKSKTKRELPLISISTTSVSGSQESDFDDDDASTPSGDNTDKNPISLLSGSTESLDTIANRGKYLQSAFDSLSGVEQDLTTGKTTLSSLHHNTRISTSGVPARNIPLVNEAKHSKYENDALGKREELNRIIKETRMKLQSVGYKSNLKSSQSVLDLSPIPEKQKPQTNRNTLHVPPDDDIDSEGGLRRACSLSDLTDPSPAKQQSNLSSAKIMHKPIPRVQQTLRMSKGTNMTRSSSVGILNQSESETEMHSMHAGMQPPKAMPRSNLMRPTISSQNKVANTNKTNLRRRALQSSYSTANLTMVGQDDSSSDDQQHLKSNKMARNRSHSIDHTAGVGGGGNWNQIQSRRNKENLGPKSRGSRNGLSDRTNTDTPKTDSDIDLANSEVTSQLCNKIAEQLTHTAENVVQLYRRLTLNETLSPEQSTNSEEIDKSHMMKNLECAMLETQKILQLAVKQQQQQQDVNNLQDGNGHGGGSESIDVISHNNLRDLVAMSTAANNSANNSTNQANVVLMMQQYSDILLNMMQQKMQQKHS